MQEDEDVLETREERNSVHVHTYSTLTEVARRHQHVITSVSAPARVDDDSHIHRLRVRTSFVDGHWHWFDIFTDTALPMPENMHAHYYAGKTSVDDGHCHVVLGITDLAPDENC